MSEAAQPIDRDEKMLSRLAELDLAWVERVHAQAMAATETDEINALGRTYQRAARSLRQTLALKAKLKHDGAEAAARAKARQPLSLGRAGFEPDLDGHRIDRRIEDLQDAVGRVIAATCADAAEREAELYERLDREMDDWVLDELFGLEDLDDHVADVCKALSLPGDLARTWRKLPQPVWTPDPATRGEPQPAADPPVPSADTG
jgi:hypothetical protein